MTKVEVLAPAKINLSLHITGQRRDGYHLIDSLVAFAPVGDSVAIAPGEGLSFTVTGPEAADVPTDDTNLVLKAAALLANGRSAALTLDKHLPAASGIGGGSADAAAALRGLLAFWMSDPDVGALAGEGETKVAPLAERILGLGADVPMCLLPKPLRARGIGERIDYVDLPDLPAVLVNPRQSVSTRDVFARLVSRTNAPMPDTLPGFASAADLIGWLGEQRNDLEAPAREIAPVIAACLDAIAALPGCRLARMSGSGATCFGLFETVDAAEAAWAQLSAEAPDWWVAGGVLGSLAEAAVPRVS